MKNIEKFRKLILNDPSRWSYWFFLALIIKLLYFVLLIHRNNEITGFWGTTDFDSSGYTVPFENLINHGTYSPDWRMPGYGVIYLPLYFFFSKAVACNLVIIIQLVLSALSVYVLALTSKLLFKNKLIFYLTFYLYLISRFSSTYDSFLLTDSLTTSLLIFSVYYFVSYFNEYSKVKLLFAGLLTAWIIFLRQVFLIQLVFFAGILIIENIRTKKNLAMAIIALVSPFIVFDAMWTMRNYEIYKKILPMVKSMYYGSGTEEPVVSPVYLAQLNFCASWGENKVDWDAGSCTYWLLYGYNRHNSVVDSTPHFPEYIFTSRFNKDSLVMVRKMIAATNYHVMPAANDKYAGAIVEKLDAYTQSIKREKPLLFYVEAPLIHLRRFLIDYGTNFNLYQQNDTKAKGVGYVIKVFYNTMLYFIILGFGFLGIILLFKYFFRASAISLIPGIPLYTILIHPLILHFDLYRYFVPAYPFMVICAAYAFIWLYGKFIPEPQFKHELKLQ